MRLLITSENPTLKYFDGIPEAFVPMENQLWVVPTYLIFGSEELSARSQSVKKRIPEPHILISAVDASIYHLKDGNLISITIDKKLYRVPIKINRNIPVGLAAVPTGITDVPINLLPIWGLITVDNSGYDQQVDVKNEKVKS